MRVAIDGPAGAGKSTIARKVAAGLGYLYIDTGAMYRALTFSVLQQGLNPEMEEDVYQALQSLNLKLVPDPLLQGANRVFIGEQEVTSNIREPLVSQNVSAVASHFSIREAMVSLQKDFGRAGNVVMDGRDIGTAVMPDADLKIYLNATVEERAYRRQKELQQQGIKVDYADLICQISDRDLLDSTREFSPLCRAEDAIEIDTTNLTIDEVVDYVLTLVNRREQDV